MNEKRPNKTIFLTGFMGAGKTTIGRCLAERCQVPFIDLDQRIESGEGRLISAIFAKEGEARFRDLEAAYLAACEAPAVIALGGGAYIQSAIRALTAERGLTIFLDLPFELLYQRVAGDSNRPLARSRASLAALYQQRLPVYRGAEMVWQPESTTVPDAATIAATLHERLTHQGWVTQG